MNTHKLYCYRITNKINNKKYIGITKSFEKRMKQHCNMKSSSLIHQAILKYGKENFIFEIIAQNISVEEAEELEKNTIKNENTLSPNGYNLAKGGLYGGTKSILSDIQIQYIKDNRDKPMYVLYDEFSDLICYGYFKQIYKNRIRQDLVPKVDEYPFNLQFSCQFIKTKLDYDDIVNIRKTYSEHKDWHEVYKFYSNKVAESTFWDIYTGQQFKLVMPEVFTKENKKIRTSICHSGEHNSKAKLTKEDVIEIRRKYKEDNLTRKEISELYPQVSHCTINDILSHRTWKNI